MPVEVTTFNVPEVANPVVLATLIVACGSDRPLLPAAIVVDGDLRPE